jgi:hypothetical protein
VNCLGTIGLRFRSGKSERQSMDVKNITTTSI